LAVAGPAGISPSPQYGPPTLAEVAVTAITRLRLAQLLLLWPLASLFFLSSSAQPKICFCPRSVTG
jgi:hypothetical protein